MITYQLNWAQRIILALAGAVLLSLNGCSVPLTPEVIQALAGDNASVCGRAGVRGGVGAMPLGTGATVPVGGYGSAELEFCRSNYPGASLSMSPGGAITITHGATKGAVP